MKVNISLIRPGTNKDVIFSVGIGYYGLLFPMEDLVVTVLSLFFLIFSTFLSGKLLRDGSIDYPEFSEMIEKNDNIAKRFFPPNSSLVVRFLSATKSLSPRDLENDLNIETWAGGVENPIALDVFELSCLVRR